MDLFESNVPSPTVLNVTVDTLEDQKEPKPKTKRIRVPNSCIICRKRKIKCNKGRPACDQCTKRNIPHICHYEDPQWMSYTKTDNEQEQPTTKQLISPSSSANDNVPFLTSEHIPLTGTSSSLLTTTTTTTTTTTSDPTTFGQGNIDELLLRIKHLEAAVNLTEWTASTDYQRNKNTGSLIPPPNADYDPNSHVQLTDQLPFLIPFVMRKSRIEYHGVLSPINVIKTDPFLKVIWLHMWRYLDIAMERSQQLDPTESIYGLNTVPPLNGAIMQFLDLRLQKVQFKKYCATLNAPNVDLKVIILKHLPTRRVILTLCLRFFKHIYPLFPLIDGDSFLGEDVSRLLGGWINMNSQIDEILTTKSHDIALISILFSIMAISSLTISESEFNNSPDFKTLQGTCTAIYSHVAMLCIEHYKPLSRISGPKVIMAMLLLKLYQEFCTEDDSISDRTQGRIQLGSINAMARAAGLHVDPTELASRMDKDKKLRIWRKFWHKLMDMDAVESIQMGTVPRYADDSAYDTQMPQYDMGLPLEELFVVEDYKFMAKKTELYRRTTTTLFQRKRPPTIGQLLEIIEELQLFTSTELGSSLKDILTKNVEPYARLKKITYLLELNKLEADLRLRAIVHFHKLENMNMMYDQYCLLLTHLTRMLNTTLNVCYNVDEYVGLCYTFYLRPTLMNASIVTMISLAMLLARCLQCIKRVPMENHARLGVFRELQREILVVMDRASQLNNKVNAGYYNSQRTNLALSVFIRMIQDPSFDFDKALDEVTMRPVVDPENARTHSLHGIKREEIPETNFLTNLLTVEIDSLRYRLESNLSEVLQPLVGDWKHINPNDAMIFPLQSHATWLAPYHFGKISQLVTVSKEERDESERIVRKCVSLSQMNRRVSTLFEGNATMNSSPTTGMSPEQPISGGQQDSLSVDDGNNIIPGLALTGQEISELYGLFDEYSWLNSESQGVTGFDL